MRSVKAAAWVLVAFSLISFAVGVVLARLYLCGAPGPWAFLVSFVLCCLGALAFWAAAWRSRSARRSRNYGPRIRIAVLEFGSNSSGLLRRLSGLTIHPSGQVADFLVKLNLSAATTA